MLPLKKQLRPPVDERWGNHRRAPQSARHLKSSLRTSLLPAPPPPRSPASDAIPSSGTDWWAPVREDVAPRGGAEERCLRGCSRGSWVTAPAASLCPPLACLEDLGDSRARGGRAADKRLREAILSSPAALLGRVQVGEENGAGAPRRPGGAAAAVSVRTPSPAPCPRPGLPPAAGRPGGPLPRALLLPHPSAGLQPQEAAGAELEGAVEPPAPRRRLPVSRVAGRGWGRLRRGPPLPRRTRGDRPGPRGGREPTF